MISLRSSVSSSRGNLLYTCILKNSIRYELFFLNVKWWTDKFSSPTHTAFLDDSRLIESQENDLFSKFSSINDLNILRPFKMRLNLKLALKKLFTMCVARKISLFQYSYKPGKARAPQPNQRCGSFKAISF